MQLAQEPQAGLSVVTQQRDHDRSEGPRVDAGNSYRQILRSSAIIGGSSIANMAIGLVRTKVMAMMLGPAGLGLMGALNAVSDLARTLAELGINNSGVRQIAESVGTGDNRQIARTVIVLRRVAVVLGLLGAALLAMFARPVAAMTFGNEEHAWAVAVVALSIVFRLVADGQGAMLQGMRRIGDIARINVFSAITGSALAIVLVYWLGERGVALALVGSAAAYMITSWWYSRQVRVERVTMSFSEGYEETRALLRLGLAFMASALLTMSAAYAVRIILINSQGLESAGLFQAAWAVGGLYVTFVLQAMGADFYPRLVAAANDHAECNRLVNEQAMVSLLMAGMGVVATLTLAPLVIKVLYSEGFTPATELLRWVCLGMALRVITWPLGYILVAKGKRSQFVTADLLWTVVNISLTWVCVERFGLVGAGMAFFGSYLFHLCVVYPMCRRASGFRWSSAAAVTAVIFVSVIAAVHAGFLWLSPPIALAFGLVAVVASTLISGVALGRLVSPQRIPKRLAWLLRFGAYKQ
ncbi:MAG: O-antigen translocase [Pseudomonadota bacterium]